MARRKRKYDANVKDQSTDQRVPQRRNDSGGPNKTSPESNKPNDAEFYNKSSILMKNATDYAFSWNLGQTRELDPHNVSQAIIPGSSGYGQSLHKFTFPGILQVGYIPGFGKSSSATSAINIAAKQLYTWVRHENSGHANYDATDLMMYVAAMDSMYQAYEYLCRMYGLTRFVTMYNTYTPYELCHAAGFLYQDALLHLPELKFYINALAIKLAKFKVPDYFDIFKRHRGLVANVLIDAAVPRGQLFIFYPRGLYKYEELEGLGQCTFVPTSFDSTVEGWINYVEGLFNGLNTSESIGIMSGDILKAYGEDKCVHLSPIADDFMTAPAYIPSYLLQIHNAICVGEQGEAAKLNLTQDVNGVLHYLDDGIWTITSGAISPTRTDLQWHIPLNRLVDYPVMNPSGDMQLEATRFAVTGRLESDGTDTTLYLDDFGSELVTEMSYYQHWDSPNTTFGYSRSTYPQGNIVHYTGPQIQQLINCVADVSAFDWAPQYWFVQAQNTTNQGRPNLLWNTTNVIVYSADDIAKMHQTAILSEYDVT